MKNRIRLLQTGDLHVGRGRASWKASVALARSSLLFDVLYETAKREKCQGVLITGDIFDQKNVTNEERELVSRKFAQYAPTMPTFVIPGNHDLRSANNSNLDFLAEITEKSNEIPNLHIAFAGKDSLWEVEHGLYIIGASAPLSEDQAWIESRVAKLDPDERYIFMGHSPVKGCARNDANWKPEDAEDRALSLVKASKASEVIWWAFGDIHKRQKLPTLAPNANGWYAGSPIQMDFGEAPDRGCLVVAFDWDARRKWFFKGKRYVRLDDKGFAPLVTITEASQLDDLPEQVLIRLGKGLVLPASRHEQVVKTMPVVDDRSTPEKAVKAASTADETIALEAFDPLLASLSDVETEVLNDLDNSDKVVRSEAKRIVGLAVARFQERTYVS